ncbi:MAG: MFS transporter [Candidatus Tectomicrobia bacterium]|nr:MFS transporter [Candidatus Tectomicrobia bacterium]
MRTKLPKVFAISFGHAVEHWHFTALALVVPFIAKEFGLNYFQSGLIISFASLMAASLNIPSSVAVDVLGTRRLFMMGALLIPALGYLTVGFAPTYLWVFPSLALLGFGASFWHSPSMSLLSSLYPQRKGFALSAHELGANSGDFLTPLILTAMIAAMGWRTTTQFMAIPAFIMAAALFLIIRDSDAGYGKGMALRAYGTAVRAMVRDRQVVAMAGVSALRTVGQVVLVTFLPLYLARELNFSSTQLGIYVSSLTVASFFSAPLAGWLSDRIGRGPVLVAGLFAAGACVALLGLAPVGLAFQIMLFMIGVFLYSIRPVIFATAFDVTPKELGGSLVGLLFTANLACSTLGAALAGLVADAWSIRVIFYFAALALVLGAVLTIVAYPARQHRAQVEPLPVSSGQEAPAKA